MIFSVRQRIRRLLPPHLKIDWATGEFYYSFVNGRERVAYRLSESHGFKEYEGIFHPTTNNQCEGVFVCMWCGASMTGGVGNSITAVDD